MAEQTKTAKTSGIGMKDKLGYAFGDVGSLMVFGLVNTFLQVFYTETLGITPILVMIIMIIARVWDAINDPLWGRIVDKAPCKRPGTRYKRWLVYLALPLALSSIIMFLNVRGIFGDNPALTVTYATISYILFGMLYTGTNIPYGSMASVITTDDKERNALSVFRSVGSTLGGFGPMALSFVSYDKVQKVVEGVAQFDTDGNPVMVSQLNPTKLIIGVAILAVLCVVFSILCAKFSTERVVTEPSRGETKKKGETARVLKNLLKTRSFVVISIVGMLFLAAQMFQTTYNSYVFMKFFGSGGLAAVTQVCQYLPVAVVMFLAGKLVKKFGRKEICAIGLLFVAISFGVLAIIPTTVVSRTILMYLFFVFSLLGGIGNSFIFLMIWALANDAIDDYFIKYRSHDEGTAYSIFSFMRKLGQTIAAIIVNISLIAIGYGADGTTNFAPSEAQATSMYYQSIIIPAVLSLAMFLLLMFLYPLGKQAVLDMQEKKNAIYAEEASNVENEAVSE
ncbi:MAG: glycoside-pentoside-hexuronide (GPH):cation symporter [Bacilli bacterium]|nr:glycoside-pentoside-hexuronide (GPH):cation symporter [Bacilli bacterium]